MKEIDYVDLKSRIINKLDGINDIVLSTSYKDRVTSRTVSFKNFNVSIYFFITSKAYTKYKQLSKNPLVSLCCHDIQIEGTAYSKNHPDDESNTSIVQRLKGSKYSDIYSTRQS